MRVSSVVTGQVITNEWLSVIDTCFSRHDSTTQNVAKCLLLSNLNKSFVLVITFAFDQAFLVSVCKRAQLSCQACLRPACKKFVMWEKTIACMQRLADSVVRGGLICLKLARVNLIVPATFLTRFLNDRFEFRMIPPYLKSDTTLSFSPLTITSGW